jgi:uncharacterized protein
MATEPRTPAVPPIYIEPWQWQELSAILQDCLPGRRIWAFGSRATGRYLKPFSDLDLAVEGPPITLRDSALLDHVLDESRLPFKVDVLFLDALTPDFRAGIQPDLVLLHG